MRIELPCAVCREPHGVKDIGKTLFVSTGVCRACYRAGVRLPAEVWCFGKAECYDARSEECGKRCPDRRICREAVDGRIAL